MGVPAIALLDGGVVRSNSAGWPPTTAAAWDSSRARYLSVPVKNTVHGPLPTSSSPGQLVGSASRTRSRFTGKRAAGASHCRGDLGCDRPIEVVSRDKSSRANQNAGEGINEGMLLVIGS
jgi:hypothetical protein